MAKELQIFVHGIKHLLNGTARLVEDGTSLVLLGPGYNPSPTHELFSFASPYELPEGGGYNVGGKLLTNVQFKLDVNDTYIDLIVDADDVVWPVLTAFVSHAVLVCNGFLIGVVTLGEDVSGVRYKIRWNWTGLFTFHTKISSSWI